MQKGMFSVRLICADSYQAQPLPQLDPTFSEFRGSEIKHVPIIRVFGTTPEGEKTCLHIHGVFPYICVPYTGEEDAQILGYRLAASLDAAINVSLGSAKSNAQHVYSVHRVSGIPFYGYHRKEHQFFKIYLYNPAMMKRAADLLQNGSVLNQSLQPHEAHINYILQFMIDYNIYGMSFVNLRRVKHRRETQSLEELVSSGQSATSLNSEVSYLPNEIERQSTCELETDGLATDILNRLDIEKNLELNPGLAAIWEEERARRAQAGFEGGDSQLVNPKSPARPAFRPTDNDIYHEQRLARRLLLISQSDESTLSRTPETSVAYAAELPDDQDLMNSSCLPSISMQRTEKLDKVDLEWRLSDSPTIPLTPNSVTSECSLLGSEDMQLIDMLANLAEENESNRESVDVDSLLGSQVSVLVTPDEEKGDDEDVVDLNLTSLELDTLSLTESAVNVPEKSVSEEIYISPFPSSYEMSCSPKSGKEEKKDEAASRSTDFSNSHQIPQYDGADDISPSLFYHKKKEDGETVNKTKDGLSEFQSTCKVAVESGTNCKIMNTSGPTVDNLTEILVECPKNHKLFDSSFEKDRNEVTGVNWPPQVPSADREDEYSGYEPLDRLLDIRNDFVGDLREMDTSLEMDALLSSDRNEEDDEEGKNIEEETVDILPLDSVLNGDPCFNESSELEKSADVKELHEQYVSLLGNALLSDSHDNSQIESDLEESSVFPETQFSAIEKSCETSPIPTSPSVNLITSLAAMDQLTVDSLMSGFRGFPEDREEDRNEPFVEWNVNLNFLNPRRSESSPIMEKTLNNVEKFSPTSTEILSSGSSEGTCEVPGENVSLDQSNNSESSNVTPHVSSLPKEKENEQESHNCFSYYCSEKSENRIKDSPHRHCSFTKRNMIIPRRQKFSADQLWVLHRRCKSMSSTWCATWNSLCTKKNCQLPIVLVKKIEHQEKKDLIQPPRPKKQITRSKQKRNVKKFVDFDDRPSGKGLPGIPGIMTEEQIKRSFAVKRRKRKLPAASKPPRQIVQENISETENDSQDSISPPSGISSPKSSSTEVEEIVRDETYKACLEKGREKLPETLTLDLLAKETKSEGTRQALKFLLQKRINDKLELIKTQTNGQEKKLKKRRGRRKKVPENIHEDKDKTEIAEKIEEKAKNSSESRTDEYNEKILENNNDLVAVEPLNNPGNNLSLESSCEKLSASNRSEDENLSEELNPALSNSIDIDNRPVELNFEKPSLENIRDEKNLSLESNSEKSSPKLDIVENNLSIECNYEKSFPSNSNDENNLNAECDDEILVLADSNENHFNMELNPEKSSPSNPSDENNLQNSETENNLSDEFNSEKSIKCYRIDAVSDEIPSCLFEEDSNPPEKGSSSKKIVLENYRERLDSLSDVSLDPRDLDVYDVESLTPSSSTVSISRFEVSDCGNLDDTKTNDEDSIPRAELQESQNNLDEESVPDEESPTFEALSPQPEVSFELNEVLKEEFSIRSKDNGISLLSTLQKNPQQFPDEREKEKSFMDKLNKIVRIKDKIDDKEIQEENVIHEIEIISRESSNVDEKDERVDINKNEVAENIERVESKKSNFLEDNKFSTSMKRSSGSSENRVECRPVSIKLININLSKINIIRKKSQKLSVESEEKNSENQNVVNNPEKRMSLTTAHENQKLIPTKNSMKIQAHKIRSKDAKKPERRSTRNTRTSKKTNRTVEEENFEETNPESTISNSVEIRTNESHSKENSPCTESEIKIDSPSHQSFPVQQAKINISEELVESEKIFAKENAAPSSIKKTRKRGRPAKSVQVSVEESTLSISKITDENTAPIFQEPRNSDNRKRLLQSSNAMAQYIEQNNSREKVREICKNGETSLTESDGKKDNPVSTKDVRLGESFERDDKIEPKVSLAGETASIKGKAKNRAEANPGNEDQDGSLENHVDTKKNIAEIFRRFPKTCVVVGNTKSSKCVLKEKHTQQGESGRNLESTTSPTPGGPITSYLPYKNSHQKTEEMCAVDFQLGIVSQVVKEKEEKMNDKEEKDDEEPDDDMEIENCTHLVKQRIKTSPVKVRKKCEGNLKQELKSSRKSEDSSNVTSRFDLLIDQDQCQDITITYESTETLKKRKSGGEEDATIITKQDEICILEENKDVPCSSSSSCLNNSEIKNSPKKTREMESDHLGDSLDVSKLGDDIFYSDKKLRVIHLQWNTYKSLSKRFQTAIVGDSRWKRIQSPEVLLTIQLQEPKILLKRLSNRFIRNFKTADKFTKSKMIRKLQKSRNSESGEFQLNGYDGPADFEMSDTEDDADVTIAREEQRVCTYSSTKKSLPAAKVLPSSSSKRKLEVEDESTSSPSKRRQIAGSSCNETPRRRCHPRSPFNSPGGKTGNYSPLKIVVTSPRVRKDTELSSSSRRSERRESPLTSPSTSTRANSERPRLKLRDSILRGRLSRSRLLQPEPDDQSITKLEKTGSNIAEKSNEIRSISETEQVADTMQRQGKGIRKKLTFNDASLSEEANKSSEPVNASSWKTSSVDREPGIGDLEISEKSDESSDTLIEQDDLIAFDNQLHSVNETLIKDDEIESRMEHDEEVCNVTFTQFISSQLSKKETPSPMDINDEIVDRRITIMPKYKPPSRERVRETFETYGIPVHRNKEVFFSDPADATKEKELAQKMLRVPVKGLQYLESFAPSVDGVTGLARWRKMWLKEFNPSLLKSRDVAVKLAHVDNERIVVTPLRKPPTQREVKHWLRARKYLEKKNEENEKIKSHEGNREKNESELESLNELCFSKEVEKSPNTVLKLVSVERGSCSKAENVRKERVSSDSSREVSSASRDTNKTILNPSFVKVLEKSALFRDQEASRHLGLTSGQIEFSNSTRSNVSKENLQNAKALTRYQYLTIMCLEVHVATREDLLPDAQYDQIAAIFYSVQSDVPPTSKIKPLEHGVIVQAETEKYKNKMDYCYASKVPWSISFTENEKDLLEALVTLVRRVDPEILIGWELETLSWGYIFQRASRLGINLFQRISRIPSTQYKWEFLAPEIETHLSEVKLPGRIVLDIWRVMRHEAALLSYTFENVIHHILNERIPCPSFKILTEWWNVEKMGRLSRWRVVEHYSTRVLGVFRILDHLDIIGRTSELARLFGIQFFEVFSRGSQFRVESVMLRLAKPLNYVAVSPSAQQRACMRAMEALPLILEPESMFYTDPIIVLDFQSLYPSIIIAHNYCFSTCLGRIEHIGQPQPFEFGAYNLRVPKRTALSLQGKVNYAPCGVAYVKPEVRLGILPRMLTEILDTRLMVKKAMKDHDANDKTLQKALHSRQMGLKFLANVTYGYTAANYSGRMPCIEVGDSVISKSKETLERAIKLVESTPKWGARVVYGDTDSLFILTPGKSKADAFVIGNEIADAVTASNPSPIKLKFEKVLHPAILQTKKRYCGYMYETPEQETPTYLAKGIETVRRDGCPAVSKILEKSLKILFETKDVSLVKKYVTRQLDKVLRAKVSIQDLTFAKEFRGLKGYKSKACVPALELTRRLMKKDPRAIPRNSERVRYVIVAGAPNEALIHCVRTPWELIDDPGLRPNAIYYVTRVIIPPLNRCFNLMGVDVHDWYKEMPHRQILDNPVGQPNDKQKLTIFQYFGTIVCVACGQPSNKGICSKCLDSPADTLVIIHEKIRRFDRANSNVTSVCQSCVGQMDNADCASLDCPILYRRAQARRELTQTLQLQEIIKSGNKLDF